MTSSFTLLRDRELRETTAALAVRLGFSTDASLLRYLIHKTARDLDEVDAQIAAQEHQEDIAEEVEELVLDNAHSQFANSEYQHSEPAPADPEEPNPDIIEWLQADEEDDEEGHGLEHLLGHVGRERLVVALEEELDEEVTAAAFGERSEGERSALVARLMVFLRAFEPQRAELHRATIERVSSPDSVPAELWRVVVAAAGLPYPLRE